MRFPWSRQASPIRAKTDGNQARNGQADPRPFVADQPWRSGDPDQLGRSSFARRIARTIADNPSEASLVVGVYGAWGEGKTSLLHMVEEELKTGCKIQTLWFNPWYFKGQEALVLSFFGQLAAKLEVRLGTSSDEFKRVLNKYGSVVSALPLTYYGMDPGKLMTAVGDRLTGSDLEALKKRLEMILEEGHIDLVVFMDDIDRLDRTEIHAVLKLVKLAAGFRHFTYVLSFDDQMVAAAVGEAYGGDAAAGRDFLEKIVQVPLHLPRVDEATILNLTLGEVDRALTIAHSEMPTDHVHEFRRYFDPLFNARSRTIRAGKRYSNALAFALPLLEGEVKVGDLLLLEALRAFAPALYGSISEQRDLLLGRGTEDGFGDAQKRKDAALTAWNALLELGDPRERRALADLLTHLFPRAGRFTKNMHYGSEWDSQWATEQRIAAADYFDRYFQYSVPPHDVSDAGVRELIAVVATGNVDAAVASYDRILSAGNAERLVRKLRLQETILPPVAAKTLVRLLIRRGGGLPRPPSLFGFDVPQAQAIFLLARALRRVPVDERFALAEEIVSEPTILAFAAECFRWIRSRPSDEKDELPRIVTTEEEAQLQEMLRQRLSSTAAVKPFYLDASEGAQLLLHMWASFAGREETEGVLKGRFAADPAEAVRLIAVLAGQPWSMTTGLPLAPRIGREQYDAVALLIDPAHVVGALSAVYGQGALSTTWEGSEDGDPDDVRDEVLPELRLARRFTFLHRKVTEARASAAAAPSQGVERNAELPVDVNPDSMMFEEDAVDRGVSGDRAAGAGDSSVEGNIGP